jgi:hypothetical protein
MQTLDRCVDGDRSRDELRDTYSFEPVCRWCVLIYVTFQKRWDSDAFFMTRFEAAEHAREMKEASFKTRVVRCEGRDRCLEEEL